MTTEISYNVKAKGNSTEKSFRLIKLINYVNQGGGIINNTQRFIDHIKRHEYVKALALLEKTRSAEEAEEILAVAQETMIIDDDDRWQEFVKYISENREDLKTKYSFSIQEGRLTINLGEVGTIISDFFNDNKQQGLIALNKLYRKGKSGKAKAIDVFNQIDEGVQSLNHDSDKYLNYCNFMDTYFVNQEGKNLSFNGVRKPNGRYYIQSKSYKVPIALFCLAIALAFAGFVIYETYKEIPITDITLSSDSDTAYIGQYTYVNCDILPTDARPVELIWHFPEVGVEWELTDTGVRYVVLPEFNSPELNVVCSSNNGVQDSMKFGVVNNLKLDLMGPVGSLIAGDKFTVTSKVNSDVELTVDYTYDSKCIDGINAGYKMDGNVRWTTDSYEIPIYANIRGTDITSVVTIKMESLPKIVKNIESAEIDAGGKVSLSIDMQPSGYDYSKITWGENADWLTLSSKTGKTVIAQVSNMAPKGATAKVNATVEDVTFSFTIAVGKTLGAELDVEGTLPMLGPSSSFDLKFTTESPEIDLSTLKFSSPQQGSMIDIIQSDNVARIIVKDLVMKDSTFIIRATLEGVNAAYREFMIEKGTNMSIIGSDGKVEANQSVSLSTVTDPVVYDYDVKWESSDSRISIVNGSFKVPIDITKGTTWTITAIIKGTQVSCQKKFELTKEVELFISGSDGKVEANQPISLTTSTNPMIQGYKVLWETSDSRIPISDGKFTVPMTLSKGTKWVVTATIQGTTIKCIKEFEIIKSAAVTISYDTHITAGSTYAATASSDTPGLDLKDLQWRSENKTVIMKTNVGPTANFEIDKWAIKGDTATIEATLDGIIVGSTMIKVENGFEISIISSKTQASTGDSFDVYAITSPSTVDYGTATWSSDWNGVTLVENDGIVTAHVDKLVPDDKTFTITANYGNGHYGTVSINVSKTFISFSNVPDIRNGDTINVTATVNTSGYDDKITWVLEGNSADASIDDSTGKSVVVRIPLTLYTDAAFTLKARIANSDIVSSSTYSVSVRDLTIMNESSSTINPGSSLTLAANGFSDLGGISYSWTVETPASIKSTYGNKCVLSISPSAILGGTFTVTVGIPDTQFKKQMDFKINSDPYWDYVKIYNIEGLKMIGDNLSKKYVLMNDLDFKDSGYTTWTPIGYNKEFASFSGVLDGNNKKISNLVISQPGFDTSGRCYVGLFSKISSSGSVKNLEIVNASISMGKTTSVYQNIVFVGTLAGQNDGSIKGVYASGSISFNEVKDKGAEGINAGGIIGLLRGTIESCSSSVNIWVASCAANAGGIVGGIYEGSIINCSCNGSITTFGIDDFSHCSLAGGIAGFCGYVTNKYDAWFFGAGTHNVDYTIGISITIIGCSFSGSVKAEGDYNPLANFCAGGILGNLDGKFSTSCISGCSVPPGVRVIGNK